jgi:hypothetical protein
MFLDEALHQKVKKMADAIYDKPSAYKSGFIVKTYKNMGGRFKDGDKSLKRWFKEDWQNVAKDDQYPVLRPTKRISKETPLTVKEISSEGLKKQIALKQKLKGKNLPPFI